MKLYSLQVVHGRHISINGSACVAAVRFRAAKTLYRAITARKC